MKKILTVLTAISVLMLVNDAIEVVLAYRKRQRKLNKEAIRRLMRNRKRIRARKSAGQAER